MQRSKVNRFMRQHRSPLYMGRVSLAAFVLGAVVALVWLSVREMSKPLVIPAHVDNGAIRYHSIRIYNSL